MSRPRRATALVWVGLCLAQAGCSAAQTGGADPLAPSAAAPTGAAASPSPTAAGLGGAAPQASATPLPSQLFVILSGEPIPLANGERIELSDDLALQITIDPYPPQGLSAHAVVDLRLSRPDGRPIDDAQLAVRYDMFTMVHGPFQPQVVARGDGHYLFPLDMIMYGAWELQTEIHIPEDGVTHRPTIAVILTLP